MLRSEFEVLTGIYVTDDLYDCIEQAYMESKEDKSVFCEKYKSNKNGLAQAIQQKACWENMENRKENKKTIDEYISMIKGLKKEIKRLEGELEKEQGWETYENSAMNDTSYDALAKSGRKMSDDEAEQLISDEFGFQKDCVNVRHHIGVFQKGKNNRIRKTDVKKREPVYESTDYNYVRFDVATQGLTWMYEMVNGELERWCE